jgi:hypothetical protein
MTYPYVDERIAQTVFNEVEKSTVDAFFTFEAHEMVAYQNALVQRLRMDPQFEHTHQFMVENAAYGARAHQLNGRLFIVLGVTALCVGGRIIGNLAKAK